MNAAARLAGQVVSVQSERQGGVAVSWVGTSLLVQDASDFAREGGQFTRDDGVTLYGFTAVAEGVADGEPDTVTTAVAAPGSWPAGEVRVDVWPAAVDVYAEVAVDDGRGSGDSVQAVVPHALRPLLVEGLRDSVDRENVLIELVGQQWVVADVIGRRAQVQMAGLADDVVAAIDSANGKATVIHKTTAPGSGDLGYPVGSTWFQHAADAAGKMLPATIGMWSFDGAAWQPMELADQVIGNLDAGSITTGVLQGIEIYSPSATATPRTHMGGGQIEVIRSDGEREYTTVQLGGAGETDQMMLYDGGLPYAGFDALGNGLAQSLSVSGDVVMGGRSLSDWQALVPLGLIESYPTPQCESIPAGSSETGQFDFSFQAIPGHVHRIVFDGYVAAASGTRFQIGIRIVSAAVAGADAATPTVANSALLSWSQHVSGAAGAQRFVSTALYQSGYSQPVEHRVLITLRNLTANAAVSVSNGAASRVDVYSVGGFYSGSRAGDTNLNNGGVTPYSGTTTTPPPPAAVKKTYTTSWRASAGRSFKLGSAATDAAYSGNYNGDQRASWFLFGQGAISSSASGEVGKTLQQALTGAGNISGYYTLTCTHTYNSGGANVQISWHGQTSIPASTPSTGSNPVTTLWKLGKANRSIPAAELSRLATGASRGIVIGSNAGQANLSSYAKHSIALADVTLTITYTR